MFFAANVDRDLKRAFSGIEVHQVQSEIVKFVISKCGFILVAFWFRFGCILVSLTWLHSCAVATVGRRLEADQS